MAMSSCGAPCLSPLGKSRRRPGKAIQGRQGEPLLDPYHMSKYFKTLTRPLPDYRRAGPGQDHGPHRGRVALDGQVGPAGIER